MSRTALIAGVTGIVGNNLATLLASHHWNVLGLARRPSPNLNGVQSIAADLLDPVADRVG